jgi:hypothetical protein
MLFFGYYASHTNPQPDRRDIMNTTTSEALYTVFYALCDDANKAARAVKKAEKALNAAQNGDANCLPLEVAYILRNLRRDQRDLVSAACNVAWLAYEDAKKTAAA